MNADERVVSSSSSNSSLFNERRAVLSLLAETEWREDNKEREERGESPDTELAAEDEHAGSARATTAMAFLRQVLAYILIRPKLTIQLTNIILGQCPCINHFINRVIEEPQIYKAAQQN